MMQEQDAARLDRTETHGFIETGLARFERATYRLGGVKAIGYKPCGVINLEFRLLERSNVDLKQKAIMDFDVKPVIAALRLEIKELVEKQVEAKRKLRTPHDYGSLQDNETQERLGWKQAWEKYGTSRHSKCKYFDPWSAGMQSKVSVRAEKISGLLMLLNELRGKVPSHLPSQRGYRRLGIEYQMAIARAKYLSNLISNEHS